MNRPRDVLVLTGSYLESCYPIFAEYADSHNWRLEIAERFNPPHGWTGDGVLSMFLNEPAMNRFLKSLVTRKIPHNSSILLGTEKVRLSALPLDDLNCKFDTGKVVVLDIESMYINKSSLLKHYL